MARTIRATITVEMPYSNDLLLYGDKLDAKIRDIINNADSIPCKITAGELDYSKRPVIRDETTL